MKQKAFFFMTAFLISFIIFQKSPSCAFSCSTTTACVGAAQLICPDCYPFGYPKLDLDGSAIAEMKEVLSTLKTLNDVYRSTQDLMDQASQVFGPDTIKDLEEIEKKIDYAVIQLVYNEEDSREEGQLLTNPWIKAKPDDTVGVMKDIEKYFFTDQENPTLAEQVAIRERRASVAHLTQLYANALSVRSEVSLLNAQNIFLEAVDQYAKIVAPAPDVDMSTASSEEEAAQMEAENKRNKDKGILGQQLLKLQYLKFWLAAQMRQMELEAMQTQMRTWNNLVNAPLQLPEDVNLEDYVIGVPNKNSAQYAEKHDTPIYKTKWDQLEQESAPIRALKGEMDIALSGELKLDMSDFQRPEDKDKFPPKQYDDVTLKLDLIDIIERQHYVGRIAGTNHSELDFLKNSSQSALACHNLYMKKVDEKVDQINALLRYAIRTDKGLNVEIYNGPFQKPEEIFIGATEERYIPSQEEKNNPRVQLRTNALGQWLRWLDNTSYFDGSFYRMDGFREDRDGPILDRKNGAVLASCMAIDALNELNTYTPLNAPPQIQQAVNIMKDKGKMQCSPYNSGKGTVGCLAYDNADKLASAKEIKFNDKLYSRYIYKKEHNGTFRRNSIKRHINPYFENCYSRYDPRKEITTFEENAELDEDMTIIQRRTESYGLFSEWLELDKIENYLYQLRMGYNPLIPGDPNSFASIRARFVEMDEQLAKEENPFVEYNAEQSDLTYVKEKYNETEIYTSQNAVLPPIDANPNLIGLHDIEEDELKKLIKLDQVLFAALNPGERYYDQNIIDSKKNELKPDDLALTYVKAVYLKDSSGFEVQVRRLETILDELAYNGFIDIEKKKVVYIDLKNKENLALLDQLKFKNAQYVQKIIRNQRFEEKLEDLKREDARFQDFLNWEVNKVKETLDHYSYFLGAILNENYQYCNVTFMPPAQYVEGQARELPIPVQYNFDPSGEGVILTPQDTTYQDYIKRLDEINADDIITDDERREIEAINAELQFIDNTDLDKLSYESRNRAEALQDYVKMMAEIFADGEYSTQEQEKFNLGKYDVVDFNHAQQCYPPQQVPFPCNNLAQ